MLSSFLQDGGFSSASPQIPKFLCLKQNKTKQTKTKQNLWLFSKWQPKQAESKPPGCNLDHKPSDSISSFYGDSSKTQRMTIHKWLTASPLQLCLRDPQTSEGKRKTQVSRSFGDTRTNHLNGWAFFQIVQRGWSQEVQVVDRRSSRSIFPRGHHERVCRYWEWTWKKQYHRATSKGGT